MSVVTDTTTRLHFVYDLRVGGGAPWATPWGDGHARECLEHDEQALYVLKTATMSERLR
jgi:hypothetical protein